MIRTSSLLQNLKEVSTEAARDDDQLARSPLGKNKEREIRAHRVLLLHLDDEIQSYLTAIELRLLIVT
jgi:hypothetical protein